MPDQINTLRHENENLKLRLEETEATLQAIMNGEVDALVIQGSEGKQIYTLQGAEQPYHILVDSMDEGAVTISNEKIILYCNKSFAQMVHHHSKDIIGKPISEFIHEDISSIIGYQSNGSEKYTRQIILITKEKTNVPVLISATSLNFHDFKGFGLIFTDLSEYLEMTRDQLKLALIVEASDDAIISISPDSTIISWNKGAEKMFGYKAQEIIGRKSNLLIPDFREHENELLVSQILNGEAVTHFETQRKRKDGSLVHVSLTISLLRETDNGIYGYAITARDITGTKKAEEKILKLNEELENKVQERTRELKSTIKDVESFSYSVSHDLRAPLRRIELFSQLISEKYSKVLDEQGKEHFRFIIENAENMSKLIDNLLSFSRLTVKSLKKELVNVNEVISQTLDELKPTYENRKVNFEIDELPSALCDLVTIKQVWINLLSNAIKFTRNKDIAQIKITGEKVASENIYTISDNGAGFSMEFANKLFVAFQRLHSEDEFHGTGVGLSLVERIISKHGGKIQGKGKIDEGAEFTFTLPAA